MARAKKAAAKKRAGNRRPAKRKPAPHPKARSETKSRPSTPLRGRQKKFADLILEGGKTDLQCYIDAGYKNGRASRSGASELLTNPNIAAYIAAQGEKAQEAVDYTHITVLEQLSVLAGVSMKDLIDPETGQLVPIQDLPDAAAYAIREYTEHKDVVGQVTRTVKLEPKIQAINLAGKHKLVQAFLEKLDLRLDKSLSEQFEDAKRRAAG